MNECGFQDALGHLLDSIYLRTCRGLADGNKHYELKSKKYKGTYHRQYIQGTDIKIYQSTTGCSGSCHPDDDSAPIKPSKPLIDGDYYIETHELTIDAFDLMNKCVSAWNVYLESKGIDLSSL